MDPLYTSDVLTGAASTLTPYTTDLSAIPEGTSRTLVIAFMLTNASAATGSVAGLVVTYGGVQIPLQGHEFVEAMTICLGAIELDAGDVFVGTTLSIALGTSGATGVNVTLQAYVFENTVASTVSPDVEISDSGHIVTTHVTPASLGDLVFTFGARSGVDFTSEFNFAATDAEDYTLIDAAGLGAFTTSDGDGRGGRVAFSRAVGGLQSLSWETNVGDNVRLCAITIVLGGCDTSFNCECTTDPEAKTLAELRVETLKLTGYAVQASNPPPGVKEQYNAYLRTAQKYLVTKYRPLETERFFSWKMTPGIRYYGLRDNRNCCEVKLNKYRITGAWLQDLNNVWWPLIAGIDPTFYTLNVNFGWPAYYEVRSCIEVFPAPFAAYTLWIKGHFLTLPFDDDTDVTTINAEIVKNWAVFLAKSAKGAADANVYAAMTKDQVGQLISGAHTSRRYIPGTSEIPVPTPPVMVHFDA